MGPQEGIHCIAGISVSMADDVEAIGGSNVEREIHRELLELTRA